MNILEASPYTVYCNPLYQHQLRSLVQGMAHQNEGDRVQPVSNLAHLVEMAREQLDFSLWLIYRPTYRKTYPKWYN